MRAFKITLVLVGLWSLPSGAQSSCQDVLLSKDSTALFFKNRSDSFRPVPIPTENSSHQLLDSVYAMELRYQFSPGKSLKIPTSAAREWTASTGIKVPMAGLYASLSLVHQAARDLGLSHQSSLELSMRIQRLVIEALGAPWSEYSDFLKAQLGDSLPLEFKRQSINKARMIRVGEELLKTVTIDSTHSIPYLAGYSTESAKHIYFDQGLTQIVKLEDGRTISVAPFLGLHEGIEKALIDVLQLKEKSYLRTHQLAQRLEKELVEAHNITWNEYQHRIMAAELTRVDSAEVKTVPNDLDLTPYVDYQDFKLIETMKKAMVTPQWKTPSQSKENAK